MTVGPFQAAVGDKFFPLEYLDTLGNNEALTNGGGFKSTALAIGEQISSALINNFRRYKTCKQKIRLRKYLNRKQDLRWPQITKTSSEIAQ